MVLPTKAVLGSADTTIFPVAETLLLGWYCNILAIANIELSFCAVSHLDSLNRYSAYLAVSAFISAFAFIIAEITL